MLDLMDSESCPGWYNECNEDYILLSEFFDIYENDSKNKEIIDEITSKRSVDLISDISVLSLLPYDAFEKIEMIRDEIDVVKNNKKTTVNGFNVENGIKYATDHATSPNTTDYKKFSSDCTNFVSQILENGGVKQVKYNDENKGWWHVKKTGIVTTHKHSISWIRADTFAKYMGVPYTTKSHASFSENIQEGNGNYEKVYCANYGMCYDASGACSIC